MAWKINGVTISETSKVNSATVWGTGNKMNGVQLNICYYYDLANNNPPFPPTPPLNFTYTDCSGNGQNINIGAGSPPQQVCALVGTVSVPGGGSSNQGSRCSS
jgi:hypothetical protein